MNVSMIIEMVGYTGSVLVVVSMLMSSVVRLRVINTVGSGIFAVYALIIHSYPTTLMNFCLVTINIYNLIKLGRKEQAHADYLKKMGFAKEKDRYVKRIN